MGEIPKTDQVGSIVEAEEIADPGKGADVSDPVVIDHNPGPLTETTIEHVEEPLRLRDVALQRALVLVILTRELVEETHLAKHRADGRHLKHQPLNGLITPRRFVGHEESALVRQINENRAGFE